MENESMMMKGVKDARVSPQELDYESKAEDHKGKEK